MPNKAILQNLIHQHGALPIINRLQPFVTLSRQQRIHQIVAQRLNSIQLAIEAPEDIHNAMAALRSCEALGVYKLHLIAPEGRATRQQTVTQGAFRWVHQTLHDHSAQFFQTMHQQGFRVAGAVLDANHTLSEIPIQEPLCLLLGNEHRGLSDFARTHCDYLFTIPMRGMTESFNLSVAAAISLFDCTQRRRDWLQRSGDLAENEQQSLTAFYYLNSVTERLINGLWPA